MSTQPGLFSKAEWAMLLGAAEDQAREWNRILADVRAAPALRGTKHEKQAWERLQAWQALRDKLRQQEGVSE